LKNPVYGFSVQELDIGGMDEYLRTRINPGHHYAAEPFARQTVWNRAGEG